MGRMENGELDFTGVALLEELLVLHWTTAAVQYAVWFVNRVQQ